MKEIIAELRYEVNNCDCHDVNWRRITVLLDRIVLEAEEMDDMITELSECSDMNM